MTTLEALLIAHHFQHQAYKSAAARNVLWKADKVIAAAAEAAMKAEVGSLCIVCWGDGFHRPDGHSVRGPCEACGGTGKRALAQVQP